MSTGEPACRGFAWFDLIAQARWKDGGGLKRGQLRASQRFLAARWNWSKKRVHLFLAECVKNGRITTARDESRGNRTPAILTICNYDYFHPLETPEGTATGGANDTATGGAKGDETVRSTSTPTETTSVELVVSAYLALHPRRRVVDDKARKLIGRQLKKFSVGELIEALEGNASDPWHVERKKHELGYVLRDADHINQSRELYRVASEVVLGHRDEEFYE